MAYDSKTLNAFVKRMTGNCHATERQIWLLESRKKRIGRILLPCTCGQQFMTRADLNRHMVTGCPNFSKYLI